MNKNLQVTLESRLSGRLPDLLTLTARSSSFIQSLLNHPQYPPLCSFSTLSYQFPPDTYRWNNAEHFCCVIRFPRYQTSRGSNRVSRPKIWSTLVWETWTQRSSTSRIWLEFTFGHFGSFAGSKSLPFVLQLHREAAGCEGVLHDRGGSTGHRQSHGGDMWLPLHVSLLPD